MCQHKIIFFIFLFYLLIINFDYIQADDLLTNRPRYFKANQCTLSAGISLSTLPVNSVYSPLILTYRFNIPHLISMKPFIEYCPYFFLRMGSNAPNKLKNFETDIGVEVDFLLFHLKIVSVSTAGGLAVCFLNKDTSRQSGGFNFAEHAGFWLNFSKFSLLIEFRHVSNAGLSSPNGGLNALFCGFSFNLF